MKTKSIILSALCLFIIAAANSGFTQEQTTPPTSKHLLREDSAAVNAIVLYPDSIRRDIFEACLYPASIVSISSLQKNTSSNFSSLVSSYSKEDQEDLWNLSRYPDLIGRLVQGGKKSKDDINNILADYPQDIHDAALKQGRDHYEVLQQMNDLQNNTNAQFEQILTDYPVATQNALRDLVGYPEIISLLNDHLSLAVRVGDHYRRDPQHVVHWADSLNAVEVQQNAQSAQEWKDSLDNNPDAQNDLKKAADDYAQQNGYSEDDINTPPDPDYVNNYTCAPYSYWFGYPTWYPYSYWYPYPYWFDCGFYYDRHGHMVVIGTPSYYFTDWYFYSPDHWRKYPHLADRYVGHYYGPRRLATGNDVVVHNWVRDNRNYLPKDFVTDRSKRVDVIRQVGQMNVDARKQAGGKNIAPAARDQYFKNNATKYPSLSASPQTRIQVPERQQNMPNMIQEPVKQPAVRINQSFQQPAPTPRQAVQQQAPTPRQAPVQQPSYNFNNINKAQEYHQSVWQQAQPVARPQPAPAPRQQMAAPRQQMAAPRQQMAAPSRAPSGGGRR